MFPSTSLLSLILIASSAITVDAGLLSRHTGKATLSFSARINAHCTLNIVERDRTRAQAMKQIGRLDEHSASISIDNTGFYYTAEVGIGNPATNYSLVIDTGSANTFVGANKPYIPTNTSKDTGNTVLVTYGSGYFSGEEWLDTVTLTSGLVISNQSIGVANSSVGFTNIDGILGLGPKDLTSGMVSNTATVPTVLDNLLTQRKISEEVLGIYFVPYSESGGTGELTFGGYDHLVIRGSIKYVPLTTTYPASRYWGFNQSISYGGETILSTTAGIVDAGTTLILIASDAFQKYQSMTGGTLDHSTNLLKISTTQYANLKPLRFHIGGTLYDLPPKGQIWPRSLNTAIGGSTSSIYLIVGDIGSNSGSGLDFISGYTFLERYYSVYDTTNRRIGFADTTHTQSKMH